MNFHVEIMKTLIEHIALPNSLVQKKENLKIFLINGDIRNQLNLKTMLMF